MFHLLRSRGLIENAIKNVNFKIIPKLYNMKHVT